MTVTVLPLQNPAALEIPEIAALMRRAFERNAPCPLDVALAELPKYIGEPNLGFFVGREDGVFNGLVIGMLPSTPLMGAPTVWFMANFGSRALLDTLAASISLFFAQAGHVRFETLNRNGRDRAFARLFRNVGHVRPIGTAFEFQIQQDA
jgi:hypothetical protein